MSFTPDYVCRNPSCASYGHAHPNCRCAPEVYANGGIVHHCSADQSHKTECEYFADGGQIEANQEFAQNPDLAIDNAVFNNGLLHTISRTGFTKSHEPGRAHSEFLDSHRSGRKAAHTHIDSFLDPKAEPYKHDEKRGKALETKLDELHANPDRALNIGGDLGDGLPMHHAALAAKTAQAMTYLQSIKPKATPGGALDPVMPPSHIEQKMYHRQVAIAEDPKLFFKHLKEGTLVPQDLQTLGTLYPKLRQKMQDKAFQTLAKAEASGHKLTHKQKRQFGVLMGQPVTFQQTPAAIQAIMHANAPMQMPQPQKQPKKATNVELKQINKVNELSETPLQKLQTGK